MSKELLEYGTEYRLCRECVHVKRLKDSLACKRFKVFCLDARSTTGTCNPEGTYYKPNGINSR